jgi:hypothetical protein
MEISNNIDELGIWKSFPKNTTLLFLFHSVHKPGIELSEGSSVTLTHYNNIEIVTHRQGTEMSKTTNGQNTITYSRTALSRIEVLEHKN